jgi:Homeodomain-like domain-containing protein
LPEEVARVHQLHATGFNHSQIARETGISRTTVREWIRTERWVNEPPHTFRPQDLPPPEYAYLLGIYLGDGTISKAPKNLWKLRIFQDTRYPRIIGEIVRAMRAVLPNRVGVMRRGTMNCVEIYSLSKRWPIVFPQAGPGRKHERKIELTAWQWGIVWQEPGMLVRGLIHSDGCRVINRVVQRKYAYPRYFFTNESQDIQQLFRDACDLIGVEYRNNDRKNISVARRASVAILDEIVGPKR